MPVGVSIAPMIPFVTGDMERVLEACGKPARRITSYIILRLPWEVAPLFKNWLAAHFRAGARDELRDMRGGKDYDSDFSKRMKGEGIWADLLRQRSLPSRPGLNERTNGILDLSQSCGAPATAARARCCSFSRDTVDAVA